MKCSVLIDSSLIENEDIRILNNQNSDIHYHSTESTNLLPPEVILILMELFQNMGYNAAYDLLKYVLMKIITLVEHKKTENTELQFEISCNGKKFSLRGSRPLTEQQMDKLVNTAAEVLLSEWIGKESFDEKQ